MKTLALAAITDVVGDPKRDPSGVLTHEEVLQEATLMRPKCIKVMEVIIRPLEV
jgi:hypothetical protein